MLSTLLVIGGVLLGLFVLLAVIVSLSARPQPTGTATSRPTTVPSWMSDAGRAHPDAWSPLAGATTGELPAIR